MNLCFLLVLVQVLQVLKFTEPIKCVWLFPFLIGYSLICLAAHTPPVAPCLQDATTTPRRQQYGYKFHPLVTHTIHPLATYCPLVCCMLLCCHAAPERPGRLFCIVAGLNRIYSIWNLINYKRLRLLRLLLPAAAETRFDCALEAGFGLTKNLIT